MVRLRRLLPICLALLPLPALAQDDALRIELNRLDPQPGACRIILVAENPSEEAVTGLVLEAVAFSSEGRVAAITLLDLQDLPAERMRVRSFDLAGLDCPTLGRLLINGSQCTPGEAAICGRPLELTSQVDVEVRQ